MATMDLRDDNEHRGEGAGLEVQALAPTLIFLHIGKTAGSTLRTIIHRNVPSSQRILVQSPQLFDTMRPRREATPAVLADIPEDIRRRAKLIEGHLIFGVHASIPGPSTYFTLLRDPVKLVISQYNYVRRTPTHRLHHLVTEEDLDLAGYVRRGISLETDNSQTRAISGDTTTPYGGCSEHMLAAAKRNIEERFAVVGMTERFDETLVLLRQAFGWKRFAYVPVKVAPDKGRGRELAADTIRLIEDQNRFDAELYRFAIERFEAAKAATPGFDDAKLLLARRQRRYRPWGYLSYTWPKRVLDPLVARRARGARPAQG